MNKKIFLEQIFQTRQIKNVLIVSDLITEEIDYCISGTLKNNGNVFYSGTTTKKNLLKYDIQVIDFSISQIMATMMQKKVKADIVYISMWVPDIEKILSNIMEENAIILYDNCEVSREINIAFQKVYCEGDLYIYQKKNLTYSNLIPEDIEKRIKYNVLKNKNKKYPEKPVVGVGIITYNHGKYILECLQSVFKQYGNFRLKVLIVDDFSNDNTVEIIDNYLSEISTDYDVKFIKKNFNKGVIDTLKTMFNEFKKTDYFTFCEGDDYWNSSQRIQKFVDYMGQNKNVCVAFNSLYILNDNTKQLKVNPQHMELEKSFFLTSELIENRYFIGNLGCCFYDSFFLNYIDQKIFNLPLYDFFLNIYYSTFGLIGHLDEFLSTYRIHENSFWSSQKAWKKNNQLLDFIDQYNKYFNYIYDYEYRLYQSEIYLYEKHKDVNLLDLMIIDNVFPNELSPFSYEEISSYLYHFEKSCAFCTYLAGGSLGKETLREGIQKYRQKHLEIATKVTDFTYEKVSKKNTKLVYLIFKSTALFYYDLLKRKKWDFVFELYPGGGLFFDDSVCDKELKKLMKLKGFKKVIVTQEPVKQYLIKKKLCREDQIELIFGVVMNNTEIVKEYKKKAFYGKGKKHCDIVFMAHKYSELGRDKGYDLFIEVAKKLCKKYDNIYFHVIGNFNESVIDVTDIQDRIKFYGTVEKSEFDQFFQDKDMIISPNRPGVLAKGAFDGFPTASCTEAGIRETVMLCSDMLNMHENYYVDNEDIIIIKNDSDDIMKKVEYLYNNPEKIKEIAQNSRKKILELYSYDAQIKPRIELLENIINKKKELRNYVQ